MAIINDDRVDGNSKSDGGDGLVLDIFPLSGYYFTSKPAAAAASKVQTLADRALRLKSNYEAHGMRTCVEAVILVPFTITLPIFPTFHLPSTFKHEVRFQFHPPARSDIALQHICLPSVELFKHPHLLLLQSKNCIYRLPGGRLRPGESDVDGLKRKLLSKLSADDDNNQTHWEVSECIGTWWKSDFETLPYPYLPSSGRTAKECTKLYLVKLPSSQDFIVPKNFKLLAVPMCQLHENRKTYGSIIAGIPQLLSRFSINMVHA